MNRKLVLLNLKEAAEELARTIAEMAQDPDYDEGELRVAVEHAYHHLNTAWNARNVSDARAEACTVQDFATWRQFPDDMDLVP
jgi:hypothetical protein